MLLKMLKHYRQDEDYLSERSNHHPEDATDMTISASPSSSTNETATSQSFSNCSSPPQSSPPPPPPPAQQASLPPPPLSASITTNQQHTSVLKTNDMHPEIPATNNDQLKSPSPPAFKAAIAECKPDPIVLPKLRLNAILASDPALQPEAIDIKVRHGSPGSDGVGHPNMNDHHHKNHRQNCDMEIDDLQPVASPLLQLQSNDVRRKTPTPAVVDVISARIPGFVCGPCGIKFSSLSTLEAHQTYYCSHRKDADEVTPPAKVAAGGASADGASAAVVEPSTKCGRTGKQYACSQCSYSADKKVSLNRHMRMHQTSPTPSSVTSNGDDCSSQIQPIDRYCSDCDIRFSSTKTYRAHKQHYCSGRHRDGAGPPLAPKSNVSKSRSQSPLESTKSPPVIAPPQPYLALPTNPIVIIPYSLIRGASVLPGPLSSVSPGTTNPDLTCFILKNGSLQPIAQALAISSQTPSTTSPPRPHTPNTATQKTASLPSPVAPPPSIPNNAESIGSASLHTMPVELLKSVRKKDSTRPDVTTPLDLSVRRLSTELLHHRERSASISSSLSGGDAANHSRVNIELMMEAKENLSIDSNSVTPEQIVCAPSLPGSPPLTPSPKRSSHSPRGILAASPNSLLSSHPHPSIHGHHRQQTQHMLRPLLSSDLAARLSESSLNSQHALDRQSVELALRLSSTTGASSTTITNSHNSIEAINASSVPNKQQTIVNITKKSSGGGSNSHSLGQPQIFVKQGVSKCKECNIVFCKYENYLAHKKHYCSARNLDDKDGNKPSPPPSPIPSNIAGGGGAGGSAPLAYQQLICAACGIKFTSLDNLSAHQMYYCPKRIEMPIQAPPSKDKCSKCKTVHDATQPCPLNQNIYKCPICDVVSTSAAESRRHIDTHAGVKAFRCSICRYKGNTLRGMRTHIRMHFDKKSSDFNEEHYISCILEEDGLEIPPAMSGAIAPASSATTAAGQHQAPSQQAASLPPPQSDSGQPQLHCCDKCNYSSSYKGNVVRHIKLVHSQNHHHHAPTSPSLGEGGESLILPNTDAIKHPSTPYSVTIKTEPIDENPKSNISDNIKEPPMKLIKLEIDDDDEEDNETNHQMNVSENSYAVPASFKRNHSSPVIPNATNVNVIAPIPTTTPNETKHCNICDITFNYLNTFIAHKKFYCKTSNPDLVDGGQPGIVVNNAAVSPQSGVTISRAETSVL